MFICFGTTLTLPLLVAVSAGCLTNRAPSDDSSSIALAVVLLAPSDVVELPLLTVEEASGCKSSTENKATDSCSSSPDAESPTKVLVMPLAASDEASNNQPEFAALG